MASSTRFFNNLTHYNTQYETAPRGNTSLHDYGRGGMTVSENPQRQVQKGDFMRALGGDLKPMNYLKPELPITKKQTMERDALASPFVQAEPRPMVYDKLDAPKTTLRETTLGPGPSMNLRGNMHDYAPDIDVYVPNRTLRQETYVEDYVRNPMGDVAPRLREDIEGMKIHSGREEISQGRLMAHVGPSTRLGAEDLNVALHRNVYRRDDAQYERTVERGRFGYNSAQMAGHGDMRFKDALPNEELSGRLDPVVLSSLQTNPYAHSFASAR